MNATLEPRRCSLFNCDRRHGNICCQDCGYKKTRKCKNPRLNGPERCGQVIVLAAKHAANNSKIRAEGT